MGPAGNCPCLRKQRGEYVPIVEAFIPPEVWAFLTEEEQNHINELKLRAAMRSIFGKQTEASNVHTPSP
jgi:hypothetical protein